MLTLDCDFAIFEASRLKEFSCCLDEFLLFLTQFLDPLMVLDWSFSFCQCQFCEKSSVQISASSECQLHGGYFLEAAVWGRVQDSYHQGNACQPVIYVRQALQECSRVSIHLPVASLCYGVFLAGSCRRYRVLAYG